MLDKKYTDQQLELITMEIVPLIIRIQEKLADTSAKYIIAVDFATKLNNDPRPLIFDANSFCKNSTHSIDISVELINIVIRHYNSYKISDKPYSSLSLLKSIKNDLDTYFDLQEKVSSN